MQRKIKILIIALVLAIVVPQVAMAAWWNPFSWGIWNRIFHFQKTKQKQEIKQEQKLQPVIEENSPANDFKTRKYTNYELGISFWYPTEIGEVSFLKNKNEVSGTEGISYISSDSSDQTHLIFLAFSKDYKNYLSTSRNDVAVKPNWTAEEFAKNMGFDPSSVLFVKKLSEKALLTAIYTNYECSPGITLKVYVPFSDDFPNFQILIHNASFEKDPLIKEYLDKEIKKNGDGCDMKEAYKLIAKNIQKGKYADVNNYVEIAGKIADSVENHNPPKEWSKYINNEFSFEMSFPDSWDGYVVERRKWEGRGIDASNKNKEYSGDELVFVNPKNNFTGDGSKKDCWQDITIMAISKDVWNLIAQEKIAVSAAPIGPAKIGENSKFVFALPPRWAGFVCSLGVDEAWRIVRTFKPN